MNILITGGAGYIGASLLVPLLKKGHKVTVYDSLMFNNGDHLIPFMAWDSFNFIRGDICDDTKISNAVKNHDAVIHLAALVGFPICNKLGLSQTNLINIEGTKNVIKSLSNDQYLIFGSTSSNYGSTEEECVETTELRPSSTYGLSKTIAEKEVLSRQNSTVFRLATVFGVSPRLRLDLLINDLTYKLMTDKYVTIYESHFIRTFIHIKDVARAFIFSLENQNNMKDNVYNIGSNKMNFSKKHICETIAKLVPNKTYINYADIGKDEDKRNYTVNYNKVHSLGFDTEVSLEEGIKELIKTIPVLTVTSNYHSLYHYIG